MRVDSRTGNRGVYLRGRPASHSIRLGVVASAGAGMAEVSMRMQGVGRMRGFSLVGVILLAGCGGGIVNYGTITTFAGTGTAGYTGDGGAAASAKLGSPTCAAVDSAGNIFIVDAANHVVREVNSGGTITTYAGTGVAGYTGDGGAATAAQLNSPNGCAVDGAGNLYIADTVNNVIREVTASTGLITTVAGSGLGAGTAAGSFSGDGGVATLAAMNHPYGVAVDTAGDIYISDTLNYRVRKVNAGGVITTIAGTGVNAYTGDGGAATSATLYNPEGLLVTSAGDVLVAEEANSVVRKIAASGTISTFAGSAFYGYQGDGGSATNARLEGPTDVALDAAGNVYITDTANMVIRRVTTDGTIQTVAGNGDQGYSGDGKNATDAMLNRPRGISIDAKGVMYIADTGNAAVRKVTPAAQ
jgi:sugar lactone lactonase YvrE